VAFLPGRRHDPRGRPLGGRVVEGGADPRRSPARRRARARSGTARRRRRLPGRRGGTKKRSRERRNAPAKRTT
jgi:hypothetical protein